MLAGDGKQFSDDVFSMLTQSRIFIIEGLATIAFAPLAKLMIVDWPETADFLKEEEKALLALRLRQDGASGVARMDTLDRKAIFRILKDWKIWIA